MHAPLLPLPAPKAQARPVAGVGVLLTSKPHRQWLAIQLVAHHTW
jgi:hypothetical protein